ncbi:MAG: hypothetical protein NTX25_05665, partial [Proteobacteria bacterium]|nr:hypothetical protein [Pseudomonadota bacterium]
ITSTSNANAGINASVTVGVPSGPNVTIGGEAGVAGGSEQGTSTQKGPMTQKELDTLWNKYYEVGKKDPQKAGFEPDILCMQNEKDCLTSSGQNFKNTSYKPDSPSKKEENGSNKSSSNSSSSTTPFSDNNSKTSSSSSASDDKTPGSITASHAGSWAGEPSKPSDGSVWADFGQEEPGNDPMALCIFDAYKEKEKDSSNKTYDTSGSADNRSDVQKKRDAENLLKKGICDEKFFGREYCANWKQKRQMIDSPPGAFDGQTPLVPAGEQRERPGFLHFDPYQKETFKIPADLGPNILPGANGGTRELPRIK